MLEYTYLISESDFESFGPNELVKYDYLTVVRVGEDFSSLSEFDKSLIQTGLSAVLSDKIAILLYDQIQGFPPANYLRSLCELFGDKPLPKQFIGVVTVLPHVNDDLFLSPCIREISPEKYHGQRFALYEAIQECMKEMLFEISQPVLARMNFSWENKSKGLVIPKRNAVRHYRKPFGSIQKIDEQVVLGKIGTKCGVGLDTLKKIEQYVPVSITTLERYAQFLGTQTDLLYFKTSVPKADVLVAYRNDTGLSYSELCHAFSVPSTLYFVAIEYGEPIRSDALVFAWKSYSRILDMQIKMRDLLDLDRMEDYPI